MFLIEARRKSAAECRQSSFLMKTSIASRRDSMNPRNPRKTKWTDERRLDNLSIRRIFIGGEKKKTIFVINDFYRDRKIRIESRNREFSLIIEM